MGMTFNQLPLEEALLDGLQAMNFKETTPVQEQTIPIILQKKRPNSLCPNRYRQNGSILVAHTQRVVSEQASRR